MDKCPRCKTFLGDDFTYCPTCGKFLYSWYPTLPASEYFEQLNLQFAKNQYARTNAALHWARRIAVIAGFGLICYGVSFYGNILLDASYKNGYNKAKQDMATYMQQQLQEFGDAMRQPLPQQPPANPNPPTP